MNSCDYGHETASETRRLPIGADSGVMVCRDHYAAELGRRSMTREDNPEAWDDPQWFPRWEDLPVYEKEGTR